MKPTDNTKVGRPWYQLNRITWLASILLVVSLLLESPPRNATTLCNPTMLFGSMPSSIAENNPVMVPQPGATELHFQWPKWDVDPDSFPTSWTFEENVVQYVLDAIVYIGFRLTLLVSFVWTFERLIRYRQNLNFSLLEMATITLSVAIFCRWPNVFAVFIVRPPIQFLPGVFLLHNLVGLALRIVGRITPKLSIRSQLDRDPAFDMS